MEPTVDRDPDLSFAGLDLGHGNVRYFCIPSTKYSYRLPNSHGFGQPDKRAMHACELIMVDK